MPRDNALARALFLCRLGEIGDRSFEQQRYRASGLTLVTAAIALWNTVYIERAVQASARNGEVLDPKLLKYLSPLGWEHINLAGDYQWAAQETHSGAIQATSNPEPILNVLYCPFSDLTPLQQFIPTCAGVVGNSDVAPAMSWIRA